MSKFSTYMRIAASAILLFMGKYSSYIRIAVSAFLLGIVAWRTDWNIVREKFANLNWGLWLLAIGVSVAAQGFSARRWQLFAREMQFVRTLPQYFAFYLIGAFFNLVFPTSVGGDVVRVLYLDAKSGRKLAAFASVFLERVNGLLVLIGVACVGVLVTPIPLPGWIHAIVWSVGGCALAGIIALPLLQRWPLVPLERRVQMKALLDQVHAPRVLGEATLMSVLVQVSGVIGLWLIALSLGIDLPPAYFCILGPMVSLLTLLPITMNGMGVRELGTIVFLAPLSVNEDAAKTLAFLWFASSVAISLLGGLVYLFGANLRAGAAAAQEGIGHGSVDRDSDQGREGEYKKAA